MSAPDLGAAVADLSARLAMAESRLDALETNGLPSGRNRAARGLAEMADKIDSETPGKVPGYELQKLESRERPPEGEIEAMGEYLACGRARTRVE